MERAWCKKKPIQRPFQGMVLTLEPMVIKGVNESAQHDYWPALSRVRENMCEFSALCLCVLLQSCMSSDVL